MSRCRARIVPVLVAASVASLGACAQPTATPPPADPRIAEIREMLRAGEWDAGLARATALLVEARAQHGPSLELARALDLVAEYYWTSGKASDTRALVFARRALELKTELSDSKAELATSLRGVAKVHEGQGESDLAQSEFERVIELRKEAFGAQASEVGAALFDLGRLYHIGGRMAEAESTYERALAIQTLRPDDPDVDRTLQNLGIVHHDQGHYEPARSFYERALAVREQRARDAKGELNVAWTLNSLGLLLYEIGDYDGAAQCYERSLSIRRARLGEQHPHVAVSLANVALLEKGRGDYARARSLYEQALAIEVAAFPPDNPAATDTRQLLARLLWDLGDYSGAERLYGEAIAFWERSPQPDDLPYAVALQGLSASFVELGRFDRAQEMQERALAMLESRVGSEHVHYAYSLTRYAVLRQRMHDGAAAIELQRRALAIREKALGPEHVELVENLVALARLYLAQREPAEARPLLDRALAISETALSRSHPSVAEVLRDRSLVLASAGDVDGALAAALEAEEIGRRHLRVTMRTLPEREALRFAAVRASGLDPALALAAAGLGGEGIEKVWDSLARSRALVLDEMAARRRAVREDPDPDMARLARDLRASSQRLANLWVRGPGELDPQRYRGLLEAAAQQVEIAERALGEKSDAFRRQHEREAIGYPEIAKALPPRSALVAFALYRNMGSEADVDEAVSSYIAFVLPGDGSAASAIPLGPAASIDRAVERWAAEARSGARLETRSTEKALAAYREAGEELRRAIWDPLAARLGSPERIFVVADGALNLVSLAALPAGRDAYLVESAPSIHYVSAERDLAAQPRERASGQGLLAIGGPDFETGSGSRCVGTRPVRAELRGRPCESLQDVRFVPLPAASGEVEEIAGLWSTQAQAHDKATASVVRLTGAAASESAFKEQAAGHRVLHFGTHGFFLGGECGSSSPGTRGVHASAAEPALDNPLLLSGLALAGANCRDASEVEQDDGMLMASEIAAMDLAGVEWAVLAACDTGAGELRAGEGVFGLRRAFETAGARTTIMSLWPVGDRFTREWMVELYRGRLAEGLATDTAVHAATLRLLERARARGNAHPFYWAGFVAAGDWR